MDALRVDVSRVGRGESWPEVAAEGSCAGGIWRCPEATTLALLTARVANMALGGSGLVVEMDDDIIDNHRGRDGWDIPILRPSWSWPVMAVVSVRLQVAALFDGADVVIQVSTVDDSESGRHHLTALACAHAIAEDMRRGPAAAPTRAVLRWMAEDHARRSTPARAAHPELRTGL